MKKEVVLLLTIILCSIVGGIYGTSTDYYGTFLIDGVAAPVGAIVVSYVDDINAANYTIDTQGQYGLLSIRGDDPDTGTKDGGLNGDYVDFRLVYGGFHA